MTRLTHLLAAALLAAPLLAQEPAAAPKPKASRPGAHYVAPSATSDAAKVIAEIKAHQEAVANLQEMTDTIGARLTGSAALVKAHDWMEAKLKAYGATKVWRESYDFGPSWTRGTATARLLTQNGQELSVRQMAWTPATKGTLKAEAAMLTADTWEELTAKLGQLKGKVAVLGRFPRPKPGADMKAFGEGAKAFMGALKKAEFAAALFPSEKKDGQMTMGGSPGGDEDFLPLPPVPVAVLNSEHMTLLNRLLARKEKVELELNLGGKLSEKRVDAYNSIAEFRGTEKPEEIVLLGAHLDSWDLGTGATDNGTGSVAVVEALRALIASGVKPKRTIRVALFSGEEQGIFGSKAYVKAHAAELANHQAVLIHDLGTGQVRGFAMQGREDLRPYFAKAIAPLQEQGVRELPLEASEDSDHAPFVEKGVPAVFCIQDEVDYFTTTHHSFTDTFEHVKPEQLVQGATAMAVTALELANMPERLPHAAPAPEAKR
ncbi:MAG TPA: M20/M25/M40 family metallo-hydrolase [Holophagaceae bacterium]|nr:M20/M25/M40 family metallo-hydrolase [Holophagaceae bacterium]